MPGIMVLRIWDVEHGACAMLHHTLNGVAGRLAMIDSGDTDDWNLPDNGHSPDPKPTAAKPE